MLEVRNVSVTYPIAGKAVKALAGVDLALPSGSFTTVVGRSGCGKTTLLRVLARLVAPTSGEIRFDGETAPRIGYVFQEPRLMSWLPVWKNVAFGLTGRMNASEIAARVRAALDLVHLGNFRDAWPDQLSGGMAQRVALARALVMQPQLLLLDEPFAALDAFTRRGMQQELVDIWRRNRTTVVFVTHDVEEAVLLGESILELEEGRVVGHHRVDLSYPRDPTDARVVGHRRAVLARLFELARFETSEDLHEKVS